MYDTFLSYLYPSGLPAGTHLLLWQLTPKQKTSFWCTSVGEAVQLLNRHVPRRDSNWYLGCGLSARSFGAFNRCKAQDIVALPGLWLDMDICDDGHKKKNLPATTDQALGMLQAMPLPPSIVIHSGGGLQGWWLLDEPVLLFRPGEEMHSERMTPHAEAASLSEAWNKHLIKLCGQHGWTADSTHDLARVMRLPGTWNIKRGTGDLARPTSILGIYGGDGGIADTPARYSYEEIMNALRGAEPKEKASGTLGAFGSDAAGGADGRGEHGVSAAGVASGEDGRPRAVHAQEIAGGGARGGEDGALGLRAESGGPERPGATRGDECVQGQGVAGDGASFREVVDATLDNLCSFPKFEQTWNRTRGFADNSLSTYDAAIAMFCVNAEVHDRVTAEIIRLFRLKHGSTQEERGKGTRADYVERTVRTAHEHKRQNDQERDERVEASVADKARETGVAAKARGTVEKLSTRLENAEEKAAEEQRKAQEKREKVLRQQIEKEMRAELKEMGLLTGGRKPAQKLSGGLERLLVEYQATEGRDDRETQREALMRGIGEVLGVEVQHYICYQAEPCTYELKAMGSTVTLGGIDSVLTYSRFRSKVADGIGHILPSKMPGWESLVRALHAIREVVDVGEDGTDRGMLDQSIANYLENCGFSIGTDVAYAMRNRIPFTKGGHVHIILSVFQESNRTLQNMSLKAIATLLRGYGAKKKTITYSKTIDDEISRTSTRAYALPLDERWLEFVQVSARGKDELKGELTELKVGECT